MTRITVSHVANDASAHVVVPDSFTDGLVYSSGPSEREQGEMPVDEQVVSRYVSHGKRPLRVSEVLPTAYLEQLNQPTNQPTNQATKQPTNQTTNQPLRMSGVLPAGCFRPRSLNRSTNQLTNQPTNQPTTICTNMFCVYSVRTIQGTLKMKHCSYHVARYGVHFHGYGNIHDMFHDFGNFVKKVCQFSKFLDCHVAFWRTYVDEERV